MSWSKTMEKYPRIGGKRERKTNTTAKCPCGAVGKWMIDIQTSPFRGEDDTEWRCGEHKDCIEVETETSRLKAEVERLTAENARLEADAKLGRMVRANLPVWERSMRWFETNYTDFETQHHADEMKEALAAAGVIEEKAGVKG